MKRICETSKVLFVADEFFNRLGPHRNIVRLRAGKCDARYRLLFERSHRRRASACGDTLSYGYFRCAYSKNRTHTFFHSSSYTANPIACAAARANLHLWQGQDALQGMASLAAMQEKAIEPFRTDQRFENVWRTGTITALDLKTSDAGYLAGVGQDLQAFFRDRNLLLRPLGNTIYVMCD